jgi:hypothetical protein
VAAAVVAADESALLKGDDRGRVEDLGPLGEGAWCTRDGVEDAGGLDIEGGVGS